MSWSVDIPGQPPATIRTMDIEPCFELEDGMKRKGYTRIQIGTRRAGGKPALLGAHRVAWMAVNGPIPPGGQILHHCDNRACIRASHLYLGNNNDNVRDRVMRFRGYRKVSDEEVSEMRRLYSRYGKDGLSGRELAVRFGISPSQVSVIVNNKKRTAGLAEG